MKKFFDNLSDGVEKLDSQFIMAAVGDAKKIFDLAVSLSSAELDELKRNTKIRKTLEKGGRLSKSDQDKMETAEAQIRFVKQLAKDSLDYIDQDARNLSAKIQRLKKEDKSIQREVLATLRRLSILPKLKVS